MADTSLYNLGTDISSDFSFFDGDIQLSSFEDNLVQAIVNRLNTYVDELDIFYEEYGSFFKKFLGWRANDKTLSLIKNEIDVTLAEEDRLLAWETDIEYTGEGTIRIGLTLYPAEAENSLEVALVTDELGNLSVE